LGGGLDKGTSNLILGPAGTGKSTIALQFAVNAAKLGKKVAIYNFEESLHTVRSRANALGMHLDKYIDSKNISLRKVDPAELTPGQFASLVRGAHDEGSDVIIIDSLNGYIHAMPEQQFLMLQLHELLAYLGNRGVITIVILSQAGIMGNMQSPLDLTYLADSVLLTRFFEAFGGIKKAISVIKKRSGLHEDSLREFTMSSKGIAVGPILSDFVGIFSGMPAYTARNHNALRNEADSE
jgi:circadian clock protein KaiC